MSEKFLIDVGEIREMRDSKEVDISPYVSEEIRKKIDGPISIELKTLTTKQQDEVQGYLSRFARTDRRTKDTYFNDEAWLHKSRIKMLLIGVNKDKPNFPFPKWDEQFIDAIDERAPQLIRFLSDELEELNRPLEQKT